MSKQSVDNDLYDGQKGSNKGQQLTVEPCVWHGRESFYGVQCECYPSIFGPLFILWAFVHTYDHSFPLRSKAPKGDETQVPLTQHSLIC